MIPRSPIKLALLVIPALGLAGVALFLLLILTPRPAAVVQPQPLATWLPANSETRVDFKGSTAISTTRLYNFAAPTATRLKLDATTPGFAFAAEIRDAAGQTVAAFTDKLQSVQVTLAGDPGQYQIALSAADAKADGTVALLLGGAIIAPAALDGTTLRANDCRVTNPGDVNTLIRSAPADRYAVIGLLPPGASLPVIGRTDNDWYTVDFNERQGWVAGAVIAPVGDCAGIPIVRNPAIPTAPGDPDALLLQVDRDASAAFHNAISTPEGDTRDLIWVRAINLYTEPPNNFREFALTLNCRGDGAENLRWGSAYQPDLRCGATLVLPFIVSSTQQPIVVQFAPGSPQSYADYDLSVQPTTAAD